MKRSLVFDADASQFCDGEPCTLCHVKQQISDAPTMFVRVRENVDGGTRPVAQLCPDCVARAALLVVRHERLGEISPAVRRAIENTIRKQYQGSRRLAPVASGEP